MSQPPEYPGNPSEPWSDNPHPGNYPPPGYGPAARTAAGYGPPPGAAGLRILRRAAPGYGPPPQPGYGPPPGYPPPPGYGPPQPGYGPPPGFGPPPGQGFDIGQAFSWAWNKFTQNLGPLILATLVYGVIGIVVHGLVFVLLGGATADVPSADGDYGASFAAGLGTVGTLVLSIVSFVFGIFVQAAIPVRRSRSRRRQAGHRRVVLQAAQLRQRGPGRRTAQRRSAPSWTCRRWRPASCSRCCRSWRSSSSRSSRCSRSRSRQTAACRPSMR